MFRARESSSLCSIQLILHLPPVPNTFISRHRERGDVFYYTFKYKVQATGFKDLKVKHVTVSLLRQVFPSFESLELM